MEKFPTDQKHLEQILDYLPDGIICFAAVQAALRQCGGNRVKAAKLLGVGRATLYRFLVSHETSLSHQEN